MDTLDIYQRTCIKGGVELSDLKEDEIEIVEVSSTEEVACEEAEPSEKELDRATIERELECMKRRIQKMQLFLKMKHLEECPDDPCVDYEVELTCSENREICALQKAHHKLQCQITELVRCVLFAKEQIRDLRVRMCEKTREIAELNKKVCVLNCWKNTLEHEFGVCVERFEYLKHVKAEWTDIEEKLKKQGLAYEQFEKSFVTKNCFALARYNYITEMSQLKQMLSELYEMHTDRFNNLERRTEILESLAIMQKAGSVDLLKSNMTQAITSELDGRNTAQSSTSQKL